MDCRAVNEVQHQQLHQFLTDMRHDAQLSLCGKMGSVVDIVSK